jgi:predicted ferric reductase
MGIALAVAVAIHVVTLLFDKFVSFNVIDVLVPFASNYRPVEVAGLSIGSAWVAFGVLALYTLAVIIVTSLVFIDRAPQTWRLLHYLTYLVLVLVFFHALMVGTDLSGGILRWAWILMGIVIVGAIAVRVRRARSL